jgi:cytochrome b involved in lipid metabolism
MVHTNGRKRYNISNHSMNHSMKEYTMGEVSKHNTKDDIWLVIHNDVYDITDFIDEHPGGKSMLVTVGGKDATEYFEELHNPRILQEVAENYKIGTIMSNHKL